MEHLYNPIEVSEILRVSRETVYNWLRSGKLQGVKIGHAWRIPESELKRLLEAD